MKFTLICQEISLELEQSNHDPHYDDVIMTTMASQITIFIIVIGFNHGVLGLAENPARGTGFWSQNTEGAARGVLTEKARPEGTGEFPAQMASNAENVSIWWRHHGKSAMDLKNMHEWMKWTTCGRFCRHVKTTFVFLCVYYIILFYICTHSIESNETEIVYLNHIEK